MGYRLGIDIGTRFVRAAIAVDDDVTVFPLGHRWSAPTVVYLGEDGTLVTGDAARLRAHRSPDRAATEFKRRLGDPTPVMLGGTPYAVTTLLAAVLRDMITTVTETQGSPPDHIVLTHPANWGPFRRRLFEEVPSLAGLGPSPCSPSRRRPSRTTPRPGSWTTGRSSRSGTWAAKRLRSRCCASGPTG